MTDATAETPAPSRRSIPPVADWTTETWTPPPPRGSGWAWVLATLWVAAMIPLGMRWYTSAGASLAAEAPPEETRGVSAAVAYMPGGVTVPQSAITELEGKPTVFVADRTLHLLVATPVMLGNHRGGDQQILSGISAGEMIVTDGVGTLRTMAMASR